MRIAQARKPRPLVIAAVMTGLIAGGVTAGLFAGDAPAGNDSANQAVALAAGKGSKDTNGGERCTPYDKKTYYKFRQGWVGKPETITWKNPASTPQQYQGTFTMALTGTGGITGDLSREPAKKQKKAMVSLGNALGFELSLSLSLTKTETRTYNVPANRLFIAKRGLWKESHAVNRHQQWSNCEKKITHIGNITGVREMYETAEKKLD
ncbi:hypothetical protein [Streptomyces niveus]|uniref:hypothetical protein n=1 Tax=Streptomyces niveus TaxID=193462 RepID=UPI003419461F